MNAVRNFFHSIRVRLGNLPKWAQIALWVLAVLLVYLLPIINPPLLTTTDSDFGAVLFSCAMYSLVAIGLNIVIGYAGLLDLGYVGFFAVGAYTVGVLSSAHGAVPLLIAFPIAMAVTLVSGVLLGAPTLRVRGDYLAIVTLGFGEIIRLILLNTQWLGGASGIANIPSPPGSGHLRDPAHRLGGPDGPRRPRDHDDLPEVRHQRRVPYYWLALTSFSSCCSSTSSCKNSRVGRAWEATREDEDAAELMGVPTFRFKLLAFATGAAIGGLSGALFATSQGFINPDSFSICYSVLFLAAVVVGGQGNRWGVISAAVVADLAARSGSAIPRGLPRTSSSAWR